MSEVIRDAVIRLRLELQKAKLESPDMGGLKRGYDDQKKAIKETEKATSESARTIQKHTEVNEDFGRRSFQSFAHAGHGALQLARGIALMSASGEEDTRKLLESLVKIEAAVNIARGAANLAKFAGEFGALGAAVAGVTVVATAGAAVWSHYAGVVAKATEELKKNKEAHKAASEAESNLQRQRDRNVSQGRAAATDTLRDPDKLRKAQEDELRDRRKAAKERQELGENTERAIAAEEFKAKQAELKAIKAAQPRSMDEAAREGWLDKPKNYQKEAERARKSADSLRRERVRQTGADLEDAERTQAIQEQQREARLRDVQRMRSEGVSGAGAFELQYNDAYLKYGDPRTIAQRQSQVDLANQANAQTLRMFGAPVFTAKEVNEASAGKEREINSQFDALGTTIVNAITALRERLNRLNSELEQANPH